MSIATATVNARTVIAPTASDLQNQINVRESETTFPNQRALFQDIYESDWNKSFDRPFSSLNSVYAAFRNYGLLCVTEPSKGKVIKPFDTTHLQEAINLVEEKGPLSSRKALYAAVAEVMQLTVSQVQNRITDHKETLKIKTDKGQVGRVKTLVLTSEEAQKIVDATPDHMKEWIEKHLAKVVVGD